jgi:hypothetical protein
MSLLQTIRRPIAAAVALGLLAGCATNPDGSLKKNADGSYVMDDKAQAALIGAAAGCGLAAAAGKDCVKGAVIGAVAGFLIGWYFESKKIKEGKELNQEYAKAKAKDAPKPPKADVVPAAFTTQVNNAAPVDAQGQKEVTLTSTTDLIGYGDKVPEVQQKYALYDEKNQLVEEKTEKLTAVNGAGRYQSTSKFKLPASAKGKTYTEKTELVVNGKSYKQNAYKIAFADDGQMIVLAMAQ